MDEKTKNEFILLFGEGFESIVLPNLDRLEDKIDKLDSKVEKVEKRLDNVENRLDTVENRLESIERTLDVRVDEQLEMKMKVADYDKRIKKLEVSQTTT